MPPKALTTVSTMLLTDAAFRDLANDEVALPGFFALIHRRRGYAPPDPNQTATFTPSATNSLHTSSPILRPAPVTIAHLIFHLHEFLRLNLLPIACRKAGENSSSAVLTIK